MIHLIELANYLESEGLGTTGQDVFVAHMPAGIDRAVLFIDPTAGAQRDPELPEYRRTRARVIVRDTSEQAAFARAFALAEALTFTEETQLGQCLIKVLYPANDPSIFPRTDGDYSEAGVNLVMAYVLTGHDIPLNP